MRPLALSVVLAALMGGLALWVPPAPAPSACAASPSAACLADLAVQAGLADTSPPRHWRDLEVLPMMGRFDQAQALIDHQRAGQGPAPYDPLASHRIAAHLRAGLSPQEALSQVPTAQYGALWIAGLELMGRKPYGPIAPQRPDPDAATLAAVAGLADALVGMETGLNPHERSSALKYAAELRVLLGDVAGARAAVALMPRDIPDPLPLGATLTLAIGPEAALIHCPPQNACRPYALRFAAAAAPPDQAQALLTEAFDLAADARYPDGRDMMQAVETALTIGQPDLALTLACRMGPVFAERPGIFPVFPHLYTAQALLAAGAPLDEVRASLARARAEAPGGNPDTVVGVGVVSGLITWSGSGLGAEALHTLALIHARMGEVDQTVALLDGIAQPDFAWQEVLAADLPPATLDRLLVAAAQGLSAEEFARRRALLARNVHLSDTATPETRAWALAMAHAALAEAPMQGEPSLHTCEALAQLADRAGDAAMLKAALDHAARIALDQGDTQSLLLAARLWHAYGPAAAER